MSTIDEIRKRWAECPVPEAAQSDWDGSNHYEIHDEGSSGVGWWWLTVGDTVDVMNASHTEDGKRLGAVLDYACAYRGDVKALLDEIDRLSARKAGL